MAKKTMTFSIILLVILIIAVPIIYLRYIRTDMNGLTAHDVNQAIKALSSYVTACNEQDSETIKNIYSEEFLISRSYIDNEEMLDQFVNRITEVTYENFIITYEPEKQNSKTSYKKNHYGADSEYIYLSTEFVLKFREGVESSGAWIDGHHYDESFGYWLIKNGSNWRLLDWGF